MAEAKAAETQGRAAASSGSGSGGGTQAGAGRQAGGRGGGAATESELRAAIRSCRGMFVGAAVFSLFINLLMIVPPLYMLQIYDRVLSSRSEDTLVALTLLVVFLMAVMALLEGVRSSVLVRTSERIDGQISGRIFDALFARGLRLPGGGDAQSVNDANTLRQFLTGGGLLAFFDAPWMPIFIAIIFMLHPLLGTVAVIGAFILLIIAIVNHYVSYPPLAEANSAEVRSQRALGDQLRNAEVVAAMGMRDRLRGRWQQLHDHAVALQSLGSDRAGPLYAISRSFRMLLQSLIIGTGAYLAIQQIVTPGVMIAAMILLTRALAPMDSLIGQWRSIIGARSAFERLEKLLADHPPETERMSLPPPQGRIDAEGLALAPPGVRQPTVRGVNLKIPAGEAVALVGPSGAGKSTLLRGLLGIWEPRAGHARIDGADVNEYNREELGPYLGYLPQDVELFEGTVAENIARFGEVDADSVLQAARAAGVHELILQLPDGYETHLGAGGTTLSAGQRQRVGLARAIYGGPTLLALDEPNANLDEAGEEALRQALEEGRRVGRTQLLVSHRPAILSLVDRVVVLKDGRIAGDGAPEDVLKRVRRTRGGEES